MKNTLKWTIIITTALGLNLPIAAWAITPNRTVRFQGEAALANQLAQNRTKDARYWYDLGASFFDSKNYQQAIGAFDRALQIDNQYVDAWVYQGAALDRLGRAEESFKAYDKATQLNPNYSSAWFGRGITLRNLGRYEEALSSYERALRVDKDWGNVSPAETWFGIGQVVGILGDDQGSFEAYDKAAQLVPTVSGYWLGRGNALIRLKRYREALESLDRAIKGDGYWGDSSLANAWVDRGVALEGLKRYSEATAAYDQALKLDPDNQLAKDNRENLRQRLERLKR